MSLQETDKESAAFAVKPRVALADIERSIEQCYTFNAYEAVKGLALDAVEPLKVLSICIIVMKNGFTVIGKSAPASPENFNAEYGGKRAYEDAIRQLWPLMGFALRDKLHMRSQLGVG